MFSALQSSHPSHEVNLVLEASRPIPVSLAQIESMSHRTYYNAFRQSESWLRNCNSAMTKIRQFDWRRCRPNPSYQSKMAKLGLPANSPRGYDTNDAGSGESKQGIMKLGNFRHGCMWNLVTRGCNFTLSTISAWADDRGFLYSRWSPENEREGARSVPAPRWSLNSVRKCEICDQEACT